jgi:hypothetical protein
MPASKTVILRVVLTTMPRPANLWIIFSPNAPEKPRCP